MAWVRARLVGLLTVVIAVLLATVALLSVEAFAYGRQMPTFSHGADITGASFTIPSDSQGTYRLSVWQHGHMIGSTSGTSGTLSVPLPTLPTCTYQADVRVTGPHGWIWWYSGRRATTECCPAAPAGATTTSSEPVSSTPPVTTPPVTTPPVRPASRARHRRK